MTKTSREPRNAQKANQIKQPSMYSFILLRLKPPGDRYELKWECSNCYWTDAKI